MLSKFPATSACPKQISVRLGNKKVDEYIKKFKGICDGLSTKHKLVDEDSKVINFARGLVLKYKTFRTVMLGKTPYPTLNQWLGWKSKWQQNKEKNANKSCKICGRNNHTTLKCFYKWDYSYQAADELSQELGSVNLHNTSSGDDTLYVDSGVTSHMTNNSGTLSDLRHYKGSDKIIAGNGSQLDITQVGNTVRSGLKLQEVFVVPKIAKNLFSVSKISKDNSCTLEFDETDFVVKDKKTRTLLDKGSKRDGLYALEDNNLYALTATQNWKTLDNIWHNRLGHPSLKIVKIL
ncbi:hypothetical protein BC332_02275 [Capsicum chinense]|nr:hypothetical protein BC332_02275 [Capsicum chinense]